jgi:hypothetical protein
MILETITYSLLIISIILLRVWLIVIEKKCDINERVEKIKQKYYGVENE